MVSIQIIAKPIGPICNLQCSYCFYLEKENLYPASTNWRMSDEVLESFIRQYLATNEIPLVNFAWQGGEPTLLGIDFFKKAIQLQQRSDGLKFGDPGVAQLADIGRGLPDHGGEQLFMRCAPGDGLHFHFDVGMVCLELADQRLDILALGAHGPEGDFGLI